MPTFFENHRVWALSDVAAAVKRAIESRCTTDIYVQAEIAKLNHTPMSGHCYPDLVEKRNDRVVAQMRGTIWKSTYERISRRFQEVTGESLRAGITIMVKARVRYDVEHGLALLISDVVPEFSLGEMVRLRRKTIEQLRSENLIDLNKGKAFPLLPRHVAVISVVSSKGYADFTNELMRSPHAPRIYLFPALLQGDGAVSEIGAQLERIGRLAECFDAVAIVRGGGGDVGLSAYDSYSLARAVATCPLPVLTGIGHAENKTVCDMAAYQDFITPTALGAFLVARADEYARAVSELRRQLLVLPDALLSAAGTGLRQLARTLTATSTLSAVRSRSALSAAMHRLAGSALAVCSGQRNGLAQVAPRSERALQAALAAQRSRLLHDVGRVEGAARSMAELQRRQLQLLSEQVRLLDPRQILRRGYSLTLKNGRAVASAGALSVGDEMETLLAAGRVKSRVEEIENGELKIKN